MPICCTGQMMRAWLWSWFVWMLTTVMMMLLLTFPLLCLHSDYRAKWHIITMLYSSPAATFCQIHNLCLDDGRSFGGSFIYAGFLSLWIWFVCVSSVFLHTCSLFCVCWFSSQLSSHWTFTLVVVWLWLQRNKSNICLFYSSCFHEIHETNVIWCWMQNRKQSLGQLRTDYSLT